VNGSRSHLSALFRTVMTGFCARLAMVMLMFSTFIATFLAYLCAQTTEFPGGVAFKRHKLGCEPTDIGTLHIHPDAVAHHLEILFFETRGSAVITCSCTQITSFDTFFVVV